MAACLQNRAGRGLDGLRRAVADLSCGVDIAQNQTVRRNEREHLGKIDCVAEVEGGSSGGYNGVGHQKHVVAAVVVDHNEIVGLNAFNDASDIGCGKLSCQRRREHTGQGLGHHDTACTDGLVGTDVVDQELRGLFEYRVNHVRLVVAENHGLADVQKTASQRVRPDHAAENRAVSNQLNGLCNGIDIDARPRSPDGRDDQSLGIGLVRDDPALHGGNLVIRKADCGAEGLRFHRQVH